MHLSELYRLEAAGGPLLAKYQRLVSAADRALHMSPAVNELLEFQRDWQADPQAVTATAAREADI
jgi:hypothetical protein